MIHECANSQSTTVHFTMGTRFEDPSVFPYQIHSQGLRLIHTILHINCPRGHAVALNPKLYVKEARIRLHSCPQSISLTMFMSFVQSKTEFSFLLLISMENNTLWRFRVGRGFFECMRVYECNVRSANRSLPASLLIRSKKDGFDKVQAIPQLNMAPYVEIHINNDASFPVHKIKILATRRRKLVCILRTLSSTE